MARALLLLIALGLCASGVSSPEPEQPEARVLIEKAMEHWRGISSYTEMTMVIHRPEWERSMSMRAWTQGGQAFPGTGDAAGKGRGQRYAAYGQQYVDLCAQN